MLQQILKDLWVSPEILAELDDDQKQTLFCRMREEQVRRWRAWDQKLSEQPQPPPSLTKKNSKKSVSFMNGDDGEPWVWVMGEHPDDPSIDQILEREAREKARQQAEQEAQQLRRSVEEELTELLDLNQKQIQEMEASSPGGSGSSSPPQSLPADDPDEMIYCTVDELREWGRKKEHNDCANNNHLNQNDLNRHRSLGMGNGNVTVRNNMSVGTGGKDANSTVNSIRNGVNGLKGLNLNGNRTHSSRPAAEKRDALHEISLNHKSQSQASVPKVSQRVAQWEKRVLETRTEQILSNLKKRQQEAAREAEEMAPLQERLWQEQERRAKEAEHQIREIARRAREEHRRTSILDDPAMSPSPTSTTCLSLSDLSAVTLPPQSRDAVVRWYREKEAPRRAGLDENGSPQPWFHGLISRQEAEARLSAPSSRPGSFLVRLSERVWGYAISYRDADQGPQGPQGRCKHYLVDTVLGGYQFLGANQICHASLGDLVLYHRDNPITQLGGERLLEPCRRQDASAAAATAATAPVVVEREDSSSGPPSYPPPPPPVPARPLPAIPVSASQYRAVYARSD